MPCPLQNVLCSLAFIPTHPLFLFLSEAVPMRDFSKINREGKSGLHRSHSARIGKVRSLLSMLPIEAEESWMGWGNGVESTSWGLWREAIGWGCCGNCWVEMDSEGSVRDGEGPPALNWFLAKLLHKHERLISPAHTCRGCVTRV